MRRKEETPRSESPTKRAHRLIEALLNPGFGRRDRTLMDYKLRSLSRCIPLIRKEGNDPVELLDVVEEARENCENCGGLSKFKRGIATSIENILRGEGPQRFP